MLSSGRPSLRLAVFVDSENVRRTLQLHFSRADIAPVIKELHAICGELGQAIVRNAYGDWALNPSHSRLYQNAGFQPILVLTKESGPDRSDMEIALDAFQMLLSQSEIEGFLFVSGDADFRTVIRRIRSRGKKAYVAAFSVNMARELLGEADQAFAIDARLGLIPAPVAAGTPDGLDVERIIRALDDLSSRFPFVHLAHFRDKVMTPEMGAGDDQFSRNAAISSMIQSGFLRTSKQPNRDGSRELTTLELVRDHPVVMEALQNRSGATEPQPLGTA